MVSNVPAVQRRIPRRQNKMAIFVLKVTNVNVLWQENRNVQLVITIQTKVNLNALAAQPVNFVMQKE